jgi:arabinan endo-1,5-alpha-L-arabinosidase
MHVAKNKKPKTIAKRYKKAPAGIENPTSKFAGTNAIEAPFIFKHDGWYYLFASWDYCCRGEKSSYNVVVGRSKKVNGPYIDREGRTMIDGGGTVFFQGDKKEFEAAGHCAVYHMDNKDIFICHGYSIPMHGQSILIQKEIKWTADGWPEV